MLWDILWDDEPEEPEVPQWREFKPCSVCGHEMLTWRPTQIYCSKQCRGTAERRSRNYPVAEWTALYKQGLPYRKIAERYGVSYAVVRRSVQLAGVPPRTDYEHLVKMNSKS